MVFNLHTHTRWSDGSSEPERYIEEALKQGFSVLGFSDHSPVPFENSFALKEKNLPVYCRSIRELKKQYATSSSAEKTNKSVSPPGQSPGLGSQPGVAGNLPGAIEILLGIEIDFIPGITLAFEELQRKFNFDYTIGSVHLVREQNLEGLWFIDGPDISIYDEGIQRMFGGNGQKAVTAYYRQLQEMVSLHKPDIVGHLDKVKMYNRERYFSETDRWYINLIDETLELIAASGAVVEVNTRGLYKKRSDSLFPGPDVLKKILKRNIPVTVSSDAHKPEELSFLFDEAVFTLKNLGFKCQYVLSLGEWKEVLL